MSKDEAIKQLHGMVVGAEWLSDSMVQALSVAIEALSADVVEVVRCKDCKEYKRWELDGAHICMRLGSYIGDTKPTDYCSYGERRG